MASEATSSASRLVTADELLAMGTDFHGELIRGRLMAMAPAGWDHGDVANAVAFFVTRFVRANKLGRVFAAETGFVLERSPDTVRAPDVAFVQADRIPTSGNRRGFFDGPPDLAVEVISPNDSRREVNETVEAGLAAGVIEVWVVDPPKQTVTVHVADALPRVLQASNTLANSRVLDGFAESVAAFFE